MKELTDDILNKYIDGELTIAELNDLREHLKNSENDRVKLAMLQKVHSELAGLKTFEPRSEFTSFVMSNINKEVKSVHKDRFFMITVLSVFMVIIAGVLGYLLVLGIQNAGSSTESVQGISAYYNYLSDISASLKNLMTPKNISVFGSILSFGILISGYMFFESQRQTKRNLSKLG